MKSIKITWLIYANDIFNELIHILGMPYIHNICLYNVAQSKEFEHISHVCRNFNADY